MKRWLMLLAVCLLLMAYLVVARTSAAPTEKQLRDSFSSDSVQSIIGIRNNIETENIIIFKPIDIDDKQIYAYEKKTDKYSLLSKNKQNQPGNQLSDVYSISNDTGQIVFHSWSTNFGYMTKGCGIYTIDKNGDVILIQNNARFPAISKNGKYLVFEYYGEGDSLPALYIRDLKTNKDTFIAFTTLGNEYGWKSQEFIVENDGSVTFNSTANNLVENDNNQRGDLFMYANGQIKLLEAT